MAKERLEIELVTEAKKAIQNLNKYIKATGKAVKSQQTHAKASQKAGERIGKLTKIVKSYFAEITVGIMAARKLIRTIGNLTKAYMDQEDSVASMEAALRATGSYTPTLSQNLQDLAADLQDVTKYGDESTLEMAGLMQSLANLNGEGLLKTIPLVQDFATGMKIDLLTAASLIGKTLGSTTNALSRYGIILDMTGTQQEKLAELADVVNSKFGGMAKAMGTTYAGQTTILKNAFGDLKEEMGRAIARGITPMLPLALQMVENLKLWIAETNNLKEAKIKLRQAQEGTIKLTQMEILQLKQTTDLGRLKLLIAQQDFATRQAGNIGLQKFLELSGQELSDLKEMVKARATEIKVLGDVIKLRDEATDAIKDTIQPLGDLNDLVIVWRDQMTMAGLDAGFFTAALREQKGVIDDLTESTFEYQKTYAGIAEAYAFTARAAIEAAEVEQILHEQRMQNTQDYLALATDAISQLTGIYSQFYSNKSIKIENDYQKEKDAIMNNITDETAQKDALIALDEKYDKKRADLMTKQAKAEKKMAMLGVVVNTALAVSKVWGQTGIFGVAAQLLPIAMGIIQLATIAAQPIPKFAQGGSFTTSGPELIQVGDNPGGRERVTVTPESSVAGRMGNINIIMPITFGSRLIKEEFQVVLDKGDLILPERLIGSR